MNTTCHHCSASIEIDEETHISLQGQSHFICPSCQSPVDVPPLSGNRPVAPLRAAACSTTPRPTSTKSTRPLTATHAKTHRGINRNILILGSVTLLVLGGLGFFLASRRNASDPPPPKVRIATLDMQDLFKGYYKNAEVQTEINVERGNLQKENNERLARIRDIETELGKLRKQLEDPALPDSGKQALFKEWQAKQQESIALDQERREFLQRRNQQLDEKMLQRMKGLMRELLKPVEEYAKTRNYDYVYSGSQGVASTESYFLAHTGDPSYTTDITDLILKEINKYAPADFQPSKESQSAGSPLDTSNRERNAASPHPKLRIAKVDMAKLVGMFYKSSKIEKQMGQESAAVQKEDELHKARVRDSETELGRLRKQLEDPALPDSGKQALFKDWKAKQQENIALERERREFLKGKNQMRDEKSSQGIQSVSEEIRKMVIEQCKAGGFDFVADRFAEEASIEGAFLIPTAPTPDGFGPMTDVTEIMLQQINKDAPAGFQPPSAIRSKP